jgi:hypothetical protein
VRVCRVVVDGCEGVGTKKDHDIVDIKLRLSERYLGADLIDKYEECVGF